MGRPKSFDQDTALEAAAELFWSRGYEGTSIAELERTMGIGRQSIYDTFGDKRSLFLQALERYARHGGALSATLLESDAGLDAIRAFFESLSDFITPEGERRGCLVTNSILEVGLSDEDVARQCQASRDDSLRGFEHSLRNAVAGGEIDAETDVGATARMLVAQMYGMVVLAKSGASREELDRSLQELLGRLR